MASKWNKPDSNAVIVDVDCTTDDAKDLCSKYGVQGYPTLKYFSATTSKEGDTYEDGRDLKALNKFVKRASKLPCVPDTGENCDKKDTAYIEDGERHDLQVLLHNMSFLFNYRLLFAQKDT